MLGQVTSLFDPNVNARVLVGPDGVVINTPTTKTHGINEGIAKAVTEGWAFKCLPHESIACTGPIVIPAAANADIDLGSSEIVVSFAEQSPGFLMDSFNGGRFHHSGRIVYHGGGGGCAAYIGPTTPDPHHGQKIIQNAEIEFGHLYIDGVNVSYGVRYDCGSATIMNNKKLDWLCINGWDGANRMYIGLHVTPPTTGVDGFNENIIRIGQMQGFSAVGIVHGTGSPNSLAIGDNEWDVMMNSTALPGQPACGAMVSTFASYDEWRLSMTIYAGGCQVGLILNAGSNHNSYKIRQSTANIAQVQDNGVGNRAI